MRWAEIERLIRHDPGKRGLAGYRPQGKPLAEGQLKQAACDLAESAKAVGIVTGFCILTDSGCAAETDGPPGALFLARTLLELGIDVALLSDAYGLPVLAAGCDFWGLPRSLLHEIPFEAGPPEHIDRRSNEPPHNVRTDRWVDEFLASDFGGRLTHLIAIERAGPSHTPQSVAEPPGGDASAKREFTQLVPPRHRNVCHNMRGEPINGYTAKAHRLFERIAERGLPVKTIGIGDGGNEIGMGGIAWQDLRKAVAIGPAERIACRIATDWTLIAGVSNWAGYALAWSIAALKDSLGPDQTQWPAACDAENLGRLIQSLVRNSFCVDGVTKRADVSVDSLPMESYLKTFTDIATLCGREP